MRGKPVWRSDVVAGRWMTRAAAIIVLAVLLSKTMYFYLLLGVRLPQVGHLLSNTVDVNDTVVTVSIVKGSSSYVPQWVRYHLNIGVSRMVIYDDNDTPSPLPRVLDSFITSGHVELIPASRYNTSHFRGGNTSSDATRKVLGLFFFDKQQNVYLDMWRRLWAAAPPNTWLGQLDADEYYNTRGRKLPDLLRELRAERGVAAVRMHKLEYGVSGQLNRTDDVLGTYVMRDNETVTEAKHSGLALVSAITGMAGGCTHIFETNSLLMNLMLGRHECNDFRRFDVGKVIRGVWYAPSSEVNINHYVTKSLDECIASSNKRHIDGTTVELPCFATLNTTDVWGAHPAGRFTVCDDSIKPGRCAALGCAVGSNAFDGSCPRYRPLLRVRSIRECAHVGGDRRTYARCGNRTFCCGVCHGERPALACDLAGRRQGRRIRTDCACP